MIADAGTGENDPAASNNSASVVTESIAILGYD